MLKRTITGTFIVVAMAAAFLLRQFVDERLFNILIYFFSLVGTYEMVHALKDKLTTSLKVLLFVYVVALTPIHTFLGLKYSTLVTFIFTVAILCMLVISFEKITLDSVSHSLLVLIYPTVMLFPMLSLNDMGDNGFIALLLVFVIAPFADTFAYLVGSIFKGAKLCEHISPKKRISGFIGGLIGGTLGAFLVWIIFPTAKNIFVSGNLEVAIYLLIGFVGSAISAFGDLVEGALKRKMKIKDLGNLLPGHGGILDRIDSTMFVAVFVYLVFTLI